MAETLFEFDKNNYRDCQDTYRGEKNQEYYLGDYAIDSGSVIDVRADKKAVGSYSIISLRAKTRQTFKRSWYHIRKDATDVVMLWFVQRGSVHISHSGGSSVARAGDFAITKSMTPFTVECKTDEESIHQAMHVLVPAHLLRRFLPHDVTTGFSTTAGGHGFKIAQGILSGILEDEGELSENTAQLLLDSALVALSDTIKDCDNLAPEKQAITDQRLQEVLRYIDIHLSDPKLSTATVSDACGISPRYLSLLLKQKGISFSEYLWDERLKVAKRWLSSTQPSEISIAEIAFKVGFKSPAHFSRMFKRVFSKGPREFRSEQLQQNPSSNEVSTHQEVFVSGNAGTLQ